MVNFIDLPPEVLIKCIEDLEHDHRSAGRITRSDLLNLGVTSRRLLAIVIPILYRSFTYSNIYDSSGLLLVQYIRALYQNPRLTQHIQILRLEGWCRPGHAQVWRDLCQSTNGEIWSPSSLGSFLLQHATQLRVLDMEYPVDATMLDYHSNVIEELRVRPTSNSSMHPDRAFPLDGILKVDFLPHVLCWPRLRKLCIEASSIFFEHALLSQRSVVPQGTGGLTEIMLRLGNFDTDVLLVLLGTPRALTDFIYIPVRDCDTADPWDTGSFAAQLPQTSELSVALQPYATTLRHLNIGRAGSFWSPQFDSFGVLSHFSLLKSISIDATMLLGWHHCSHLLETTVNQGIFVPHVEPWSLGSLLPPSLERVTIGLEKHPSGQSRAQFVTSIAEGIAAEVQTYRLSRLRSVHFELNDCHYCIPCESQEPCWPMPADSLTLCANALADSDIRRVLAAAGCQITFSLPEQDTPFHNVMRYFP